MLKSTISQQVEIEKTKRVSQQVESDATSPSLERSVSLESSISLEMIPMMTQGSDHLAEQMLIMMRTKDRLWVMSMNLLQ